MLILQFYQKPYLFKEPTSITMNYNQQPQQYFVNGVIAPPSPTTIRPSVIKSSQQLPVYVGNKNHNAHVNHNTIYLNRMNNVTELHAIVVNAHAQPQQNQMSNQYVTPVLDLIVPQHQYQLNANHYNNYQVTNSLVNAFTVKLIILKT